MQSAAHEDEAVPAGSPALALEDAYWQTADFTWRSLQRLGIPEADLEDVMQEVYVVAHRRLATYDQKCRLTTWIFGICLRVASHHRRRSWFRRERSTPEVPHLIDDHTPEDQAVEREARRRLEQILDGLSLEQRAVFVLFELEGRSCQEVAELMDVPLGTVYSRLHAARANVTKLASKLHRLGQAGGPR